MPINGGAAGDKLVLRIFKRLTTAPDKQWVNSYEFLTTGAWTVNDLKNTVVAFTNFEQSFHANKVSFDRWTFSTWAADSKPYNPLSFVSDSYSAGLVGLRDLSGSNEVQPLDIVLWAAKVVEFGRQGKSFYRGAAGEEMVTAPAGVAAAQGVSFATIFATAAESLEPYVIEATMGDPKAPLQLNIITATGQTRAVIRMEARGIAINKRDRGYFDRI